MLERRGESRGPVGIQWRYVLLGVLCGSLTGVWASSFFDFPGIMRSGPSAAVVVGVCDGSIVRLTVDMPVPHSRLPRQAIVQLTTCHDVLKQILAERGRSRATVGNAPVVVPLWPVAVGSVLLPVIDRVLRRRRQHARQRETMCVCCGYRLTGLPDGRVCPECGDRWPTTLQPWWAMPNGFILYAWAWGVGVLAVAFAALVWSSRVIGPLPGA